MVRDSLPFRSAASFVARPFFLVILAGVIVRIIAMFLLNFDFDSNYWAMTIANMQAGHGLYGLEGYYYTPVWGYVLSLFASLQEAFLGIDVFGTRIAEILSIEAYYNGGTYLFSATSTSMWFNFWFKVPMLLCDLAVGYLIYWLVKNRGGDEKKAVLGMALWLLCPLTIIIMSVSVMFDTISVLFTLLTIALLFKERYFLGGVTFAFALLTKFFPGFLLFVLIAYILSKNRGDGTGYRKLAYAMAGFAAAFLILMLPQILDGTFAETFTFLSARTSSAENAPFLYRLQSLTAVPYFLGVLLASLVLSLRFFRKEHKDLESSFIMTCGAVIVLLFMYPCPPQYIVLFMPFVIFAMLFGDRRYMRSWILLSLGGAVLILSNNASLLTSFAYDTGWIRLESLTYVISLFQHPLFLGLSTEMLIILAGTVLQLLGLFTFAHVYLTGKKKSEAPA